MNLPRSASLTSFFKSWQILTAYSWQNSKQMPLKGMYQAGKCSNKVPFYCSFCFSHYCYRKETQSDLEVSLCSGNPNGSHYHLSNTNLLNNMHFTIRHKKKTHTKSCWSTTLTPRTLRNTQHVSFKTHQHILAGEKKKPKPTNKTQAQFTALPC